MMKEKQYLTLVHPATYEITVPGELDKNWLDLDGEIVLSTKDNLYEFGVSILIVNVDQAALQGLLRRLYSLGIPLISVVWIGNL